MLASYQSKKYFCSVCDKNIHDEIAVLESCGHTYHFDCLNDICNIQKLEGSHPSCPFVNCSQQYIQCQVKAQSGKILRSVTMSDSVECPICFDQIKDKVAVPERCDHMFCYTCLLEWSKVCHECPLDRGPFEIILVSQFPGGPIIKRVKAPKTVKSLDDGEELLLDDITACYICGMDNREESLLICDGCEFGYHMHCLPVPLDSVPVGDWFCPQCTLNMPTNARRTFRTRVSSTVRRQLFLLSFLSPAIAESDEADDDFMPSHLVEWNRRHDLISSDECSEAEYLPTRHHRLSSPPPQQNNRSVIADRVRSRSRALSNRSSLSSARTQTRPRRSDPSQQPSSSRARDDASPDGNNGRSQVTQSRTSSNRNEPSSTRTRSRGEASQSSQQGASTSHTRSRNSVNHFNVIVWKSHDPDSSDECSEAEYRPTRHHRSSSPPPQQNNRSVIADRVRSRSRALSNRASLSSARTQTRPRRSDPSQQPSSSRARDDASPDRNSSTLTDNTSSPIRRPSKLRRLLVNDDESMDESPSLNKSENTTIRSEEVSDIHMPSSNKRVLIDSESESDENNSVNFVSTAEAESSNTSETSDSEDSQIGRPPLTRQEFRRRPTRRSRESPLNVRGLPDDFEDSDFLDCSRDCTDSNDNSDSTYDRVKRETMAFLEANMPSTSAAATSRSFNTATKRKRGKPKRKSKKRKTTKRKKRRVNRHDR